MKHENRMPLYHSTFGLAQNPFAVTPDPRFFMRSKTHLDALASLIYGIRERKGFITLCGQVGTGKTTLLNTLLNNLDLDVIFSHVIYTDLSFFELLQMICTDFGIPVARQTKVELMNELFDFLVENRLRGKNALVVIDEAQNLSPEVMESLRMLSNFETSREKLIQILLCGQPELKRILARTEMRQLAQRIVVNSEIKHLTLKESERYIHHRLAVAGATDREIFPPDVTRRIAEISGGTPRIINILCDNCLMQACAEGSRSVTDTILDRVEEDYFEVYDPAMTDSIAADVPAGVRHGGHAEENVAEIREFLKRRRIKDNNRFEKGSEESPQEQPRQRWSAGSIAMFCLFLILGLCAFAVLSTSEPVQRLLRMDAGSEPVRKQEHTSVPDSSGNVVELKRLSGSGR